MLRKVVMMVAARWLALRKLVMALSMLWPWLALVSLPRT
jgi:hypothetical protein